MNSIDQVHDFWNENSCGEIYAKGADQAEKYATETKKRYLLEPYIKDFAEFESYKDLNVLEIGIGMGSDHSSIALSNPKSLIGIDLTKRSIEHTKSKFNSLGLKANVKVDNAENLSFEDNQFDAVYSWGVFHHSINTKKCFEELHRVLKPGGSAKIMIYHKYSPTGFMLWLRYGIIQLKSINSVYSDYLESPGTKAYSIKEAKNLTKNFENVNLKVQLCFADLLEGEAGQRHKGTLLTLAKFLYPKMLIKFFAKFFPFGLFLLIDVKKSI